MPALPVDYTGADEDARVASQTSLSIAQLNEDGESQRNDDRIAFERDRLFQDLQFEVARLNISDLTNRYGDDQDLAGIIFASNNTNLREVQVAGIDQTTRKYVADQGLVGEKYSSDNTARVGTLDANLRLQAQTHSTDTQASVTTAGNQLDFTARQFTAQASKDASIFGSSTDLTGRQYAADKGLVGTQYDADRQFAGVQLHETSESGRLQTKLAYADGKFAIVLPLIQSAADAATRQLAAGGLATPGLSVLLTPITVGGVFTPAEIQAQVNQSYARNDARTASQIRQAQADLAGRGFSSNSPLLSSLQVGFMGQNLRANTEASISLRVSTATANAKQVLDSQTLANLQFHEQNEVAIDSEKNQVTRQVGIVEALARIVGDLI